MSDDGSLGAAIDAALEAPAESTPTEGTQSEATLDQGADFYAGSYRTRQDVERALSEKDSFIDTLKSERRADEQRLAQLETWMNQTQQQASAWQPQQAPTLQNGQPVYGLDQLQQLIDNGQLTEFQASALWADQQAQIRADERAGEIRQQFSSHEGVLSEVAARSALDEVKAVLGQDADRLLHENREAVAEAIRADPQWYAVEPPIRRQRIADAVLASEMRRQRTATPARDDRGRFVESPNIEGGSTGGQPAASPSEPAFDPDDPRSAFAATQERDAYGLKTVNWSAQVR